jgi:hypothetical protein
LKHQCGLPILLDPLKLSRFAAQTVASPEKFAALQSRVGDGFSPSSQARSFVLL